MVLFYLFTDKVNLSVDVQRNSVQLRGKGAVGVSDEETWSLCIEWSVLSPNDGVVITHNSFHVVHM